MRSSSAVGVDCPRPARQCAGRVRTRAYRGPGGISIPRRVSPCGSRVNVLARHACIAGASSARLSSLVVTDQKVQGDVLGGIQLVGDLADRLLLLMRAISMGSRAVSSSTFSKRFGETQAVWQVPLSASAVVKIG